MEECQKIAKYYDSCEKFLKSYNAYINPKMFFAQQFYSSYCKKIL